MRNSWTKVAFILAGAGATSLGHYLTPPSLFLWHNIFQRLYYLPIVFAALAFGWIGGLLASLLSALLYIPHIIMTWGDNPSYTASQYAEVVVFFLVGGITGILADRDRRRREELHRTAEELRRVYRELQDSFEQIKRADRLSAIGQLAAGLAHEIRNPLASIEGAVDILERNRGTPERRAEFLSIIKKETRRLNRLLSALLDFARPRPPRVRPVHAGELFDQVLALVAHTGEREGIRFRVEAAAGLPPVEADPEQLQQVVINLVLNSIQAMPEGGTITLGAAVDGDRFLIRVTDEGRGIPESELDKIFDPFYTTKPNGTGLGLAVVHQIVEQHGGTIRAARNPGRGMTFTILLPLARS